jgi:hypothetical protein
LKKRGFLNVNVRLIQKGEKSMKKFHKNFFAWILLAILALTPAWGVLPAYAADEIKVSTTLEFYEALGSDRTLVLGPGQYNLTKLQSVPYKHFDKSGSGGGELNWDQVFDGYELRVKGVKNLTIRGTPTKEGGTMTDLIVDPRYAFVIHFEDCEGIQIESVVAGHSEGGECEGGVYRFTNCSGVSLHKAEMYGCGTEGLKLDKSRGVSATESSIFSCTYDIMTVSGSENVVFENCNFNGNREFDLVNVERSDGLTFENCTFTNNFGEKMFSVDAGSKNVSVRNSSFEGNSMEEPIANSRNVAFMNCVFK